MLIWIAVGFVVMGSTVLGWHLGQFPPRRATLWAAFCCLLLLIGSFTMRNQQLWPEWMIHPFMVWAQTCWFLIPATVLFILAFRHSKERDAHEGEPNPDPEWVQSGIVNKHRLLPWRYTAAVIIWAQGCAIFYAVFQMDGLMNSEHWFDELPASERRANGHIVPSNGSGFVMQTTGFTCGPSSAANLLRVSGIDVNATEAQMVPLCMMSYYGEREGGSSPLGMAVGIKSKVAPVGYHVKIMFPELKELEHLRKPMLCSVLYGADIYHAVVICQTVKDKGVEVLDPLMGYHWYSWNEFGDIYLKTVILMYKNDPFEASVLLAVPRVPNGL